MNISDSCKRVSEFDGLRGLATLCVMIGHYSPITFLSTNDKQQFFTIIHEFVLPNFAVALFYGLSAFLLSYLAVLEIEKNNFFSITQFYIRRIFRIWPLYFFVLILSFLITCPSSSPFYHPFYVEGLWEWSIKNIWQFLTFTNNWPLTFHGVNDYLDYSIFNLSHFWSISIEVQLYVFFPLLILISRRSKTYFSAIVFFVILFGIILRAIGLFYAPSLRLYFATFSYFDCFALCGALGVLFARKGKLYDFLYNFVCSRYLNLMMIIFLFVFLFIWSSYLWPPYGTLIDMSIAVVSYTFLAIFVGWFLFFMVSNQNSLFSRLMRTKFFRTLGILSYGIYIWHSCMLIFVRYFDLHYIANIIPPYRHIVVIVLFLLYLVSCFIVASFSYVFIEQPFLKSNLFNRKLLNKPLLHQFPLNAKLELRVFKKSYYVGFSLLLVCMVCSASFPTYHEGYLSAIRLQSDTIRLQWVPLVDGAFYVIYMKNDLNDQFREMGRTTNRAITFNIANVPSTCKYTFALEVCDKDGRCSEYSKSVDILPQS